MCAMGLAGWVVALAIAANAQQELAVVDASVLGQAAQDAAVLSGSVTDATGATVKGAQVTVTAGSVKLQVATDDAGKFAFTLPPVSQQVTVTVVAQGFAASSVTVAMVGDERKELPAIVLRVGADQTVEAISQVQQADIEIHQEETQRLFGAIPNYFVSYTWNAQPLTVKQKYSLTWKTVIDPVSWGINAGVAGIQQANNSLPGYGPGWSGYGKRFGAVSGDFLIGTYMGGAVFPALLHQDPRYFYKGTGSIKSRFFYALSTAVISRGDNGKWQPAYASVLGDVSAGVAANLYAPKSDRDGWSLVLENGLLAAGFDGVGNVIQEFVFKRVTPASKKSKQQP